MRRKELQWWRKTYNRIRARYDEIRNSRRNAQCAYSARYILEDVPTDRLAEITGLPEGVIVEALKNIREL